MKPEDYRDATWAEIESQMAGRRLEVYQALQRHGPCTTARLADAADMSILTVRPRVTELCQMGLARLSDCASAHSAHEGVYEAVAIEAAKATREPMMFSGPARQLELRMGA